VQLLIALACPNLVCHCPVSVYLFSYCELLHVGMRVPWIRTVSNALIGDSKSSTKSCMPAGCNLTLRP